MQARPHFGTLCVEGEVALGLAVLLVPFEVLVLVVTAIGACIGRKVNALAGEHDVRKGSPALS